jgi:hypothetical protein
MIDTHLFPFLLPLPLDLAEIVFLSQRLHSSMFPLRF